MNKMSKRTFLHIFVQKKFLQNIKVILFLDPDPDPDPSTQINADPDPKPWFLRLLSAHKRPMQCLAIPLTRKLFRKAIKSREEN
jgi:hypothetical protein